MSTQEITASDLSTLIKNEAIKLVDVRTPGEFLSSHIPNSENIPLGSSEFQRFKNDSPNSDKIVLICQGGTRAKTACAELQGESNISTIVLKGGVSSWEQSGLELIKGEGVISMERQVRIAAGLIVFISSVLSLLLSPNFIFLALFVGVGLTFSGVTNTCGMARVLAVMPWNNPSSGSGSCCSTKSKCC